MHRAGLLGQSAGEGQALLIVSAGAGEIPPRLQDAAHPVVADRQIPAGAAAAAGQFQSLHDGEGVFKTAARGGQIAALLGDAAQVIQGDGQGSAKRVAAGLCQGFRGTAHLLVDLTGFRELAEVQQLVAQAPQTGEQGGGVLLRGFRPVPAPQVIRVPLLPPDRFAVVSGDTLAVLIHGDQLCHGLAETGFRCAGDQAQGPVVIYLHVDAVQIGKTDQVVVGGVGVVGRDG